MRSGSSAAWPHRSAVSPHGFSNTGIGRYTSLLLVLVALCTGILLVSASCSQRDQIQEIDMPETPVLSLRAGWSVVTDAYTRVYSSPKTTASIRAHLRDGTVAEVTGKTNYTDTVGNDTAPWYQLRAGDVEGWVFGASLRLFNSRQRAENAAREIQ